MSERSREKIALVVFALLVAFAGCCLVGYIVAGHSWNVAATNIDDTFGSLDGYTVIAYAGTVEEKKTSSAVGSSEAGGEIGGAGESREPGGASSSDDSGEGEGAEDAGLSVSEDSGDSEASGLLASPSSKADEAISADEVRQSYEDKGAVVFLLDTEHLGRYSEGTILEKGGHRFGVFGIERPMTLLNIKRMVRYFERHEVDFVVAVVADNRLLKDAEGIDIVVSTKDENLFAMGETKDGTFYVNAPKVGEVGAVLISPSNVVSAKVIDSL